MRNRKRTVGDDCPYRLVQVRFPAGACSLTMTLFHLLSPAYPEGCSAKFVRHRQPSTLCLWDLGIYVKRITREGSLSIQTRYIPQTITATNVQYQDVNR